LSATLTFNTAIWVLQLLSILPFECYIYLQYYHLSATLTFNAVIWVLHLLLILPFEFYSYFQYCHLSATLTFNTAIWVLHLLLIVSFECYTSREASDTGEFTWCFLSRDFRRKYWRDGRQRTASGICCFIASIMIICNILLKGSFLQTFGNVNV
jgi:hypothetical protein